MLIQEFAAFFERFASFVQQSKLGKLLLNQWDLTYVNTFPKSIGWNRPEDWVQIVPGLFGIPSVAPGLSLDSHSANWSYLIAPEFGRLHISAGSQVLPGESEESLLIRLTARGPVRRGESESLLPQFEFDKGHAAILETFLRVTSAAVQQKWDRHP